MKKIAVIGGDGTGPEVVREALKVLKDIARLENFKYETQSFDFGGERYLTTGQIITDKEVEQLRRFDAILLDIDNGPSAMTYSGNSRLYGYEGILSCQRALRKKGCLAVWSAGPSKEYEQLLMRCDFHVRRYRVPVYKGSKSQSRFVWVASEDKSILPPGGGEPRRPGRRIKGRKW